MSVVDTTRTVAPGRSGPPRAYAARLAARVVDGVVTAILAILVSWAVLSGPVGQALSSNGFTDYADFLSQWDWRDPLGGVGGLVVAEIRPMLVTAVFLQVLVAWVYETGFTTLSGSTPGKASRRLRVVIDEPVILGPVHHRHGLVNRAVRMGARAALVVVPPSAAVGLSLASVLGVQDAGDMAEMAIAVTLLFFVLWLSGGRGVHGLVSGTTVGSFNWAQLRGEAERRAEQVATQRAPSLLRDVERVANQSSAGRAVTQELRRRGIDATHPEAAVAGVREVANRVQHDGVRSVADSAVRSAATSAAHTARARATTELAELTGPRGSAVTATPARRVTSSVLTRGRTARMANSVLAGGRSTTTSSVLTGGRSGIASTFAGTSSARADHLRELLGESEPPLTAASRFRRTPGA